MRVAQVDRVEVEPEITSEIPQQPSLNGTSGNGRKLVEPASTTTSTTSSARPVAPAATAVGLVGQAASESVDRPFIPVIDFQELADTLLGDPEVVLRDKTLYGGTLVTDGGPARLFSPYVPKLPGAPAAATLPMMFYMPGIDGTGLAAYRQFPRLTRAFDLRCLIIPRTDRSSFEELVDFVAGLIRAELDSCDGGRPVYLMGESFGGLMCMALAIKLESYIDRLVIVNPATSFERSPWPQLGPLLSQLPGDAYKLLPFAIAPLMANPLTMALNDVDARAPLPQQASELLYGLVDMLPQLPALRIVLPPETLSWRLQLIQQGIDWLKPRYKDVKQRALVLGSDRDLLIPSAEEAERLKKALPRARTRVLTNRSHAPLMEAGVDLVDIMKDEGFYVTERKLSNGTVSRTATDGGGAGFGRAVPIQLPTLREVEKDTEGFVSTINKLTSPVFYSTTADGQVIQGLGGIPTTRPLLLIGNHQLFAADMYPMIQEFVQELGVLPRGLAHPVVFAGPDVLAEAGAQGGMAGGNRNPEDNQAGAMQFGSLLSTYGAVPVSGRNMHKLLEQGEMVLLYPGGAREAVKRRGEAYKLIWPERAEFVRMAAKFGATIVPFAAIGADEAVTTHINGDELERLQKLLPQPPQLPFDLPFLPRQQKQELSAEERRARIPRARKGVNAMEEDLEAFMSPGIFTFNPPQRTYFIFRQAIPTSPALGADREACHTLYKKVKSEVEDGMGYLLRKRETDPYKNLLPRLAYEASWGFNRKAPSFEP